jgi:hypothetical protein
MPFLNGETAVCSDQLDWFRLRNESGPKDTFAQTLDCYDRPTRMRFTGLVVIARVLHPIPFRTRS